MIQHVEKKNRVGHHKSKGNEKRHGVLHDTGEVQAEGMSAKGAERL